MDVNLIERFVAAVVNGKLDPKQTEAVAKLLLALVADRRVQLRELVAGDKDSGEDKRGNLANDELEFIVYNAARIVRESLAENEGKAHGDR